MSVYLDSNLVIYFVANEPSCGPRVDALIAASIARSEAVVVSDLTRMECLGGPLRVGDHARRDEFERFFMLPYVQVVAVSRAAFERAAAIRALLPVKTPDALHLAVAVETGCKRFATNDRDLTRFQQIPIDLVC